MGKKMKIFVIIFAVVLFLGIVQTLPVFFLKPAGAKEMVGKNVVVYYQKSQEKGAKEVFEILENNAEELRRKLDFKSDRITKVYLYSNQASFWARKYGFITLLGAPNWYIGDNKGDQVLIISPYSIAEGHNHDSILGAAAHELIHTINYQINPNMSYWLDNGIATFLSEQKPGGNIIQYGPLPKFTDLKTENQIKFANIGGYQYAYTYIEFLNNVYGWNKVVQLAKGQNYEEIYGKPEISIYDEWIDYLKRNYM